MKLLKQVTSVITIVLLTILLQSCSMPHMHKQTENEKAVLDSLQQELQCNISISYSSEGFSKLSDFKLNVTNLTYSSDSLSYVANYIAKKYIPYLDYKGKYKSLIVNIESETQGKVSVGSRQLFTFNLEE